MPVQPSPPPALPRSRAPAAPPRIDRETPSVELRLAIGRDGLGIELNRPTQIGCLRVTELLVTVSGVRFPLDVSGGVSRFRHRRGDLRSLAVEVDARALERWAAPMLRGLVSTDAPNVWVAVRRDAATVGVSSSDDAAILAFEVALETREDDVLLTVTHARGAGLAAPPTALAIAAVTALTKDLGVREGARVVLRRAATRLARWLFPEAGARAPSCTGVRWTMTTAATDAWILQASVGAQAPAGEHAARARETADLTREADDARVSGDLARARALDVAALERAPRHPAIAARVAEIDALATGRAEAALAMLHEADPEPGAPRAPLTAELLVETGDLAAAVAAFSRIGDGEPVPALAARAYARAAELTRDPHDALVWLDLSIARAPGSASLRWARTARRLAAGRVEDALGDVEHVEAIASGSRAKHDVWRRAGDAWRAAGLVAEAASLFERALRYAPDDPAALAGLGAALVEGARAPKAGRTSAAEQRAARGAALLARAIELGEERAEDVSDYSIDLGRALAEALGDRPAAIARVRAVPARSAVALLARGLEARWRAELGDRAGASLAWARVRDLAAARSDESTSAIGRVASDAAAALLVEAAVFERDHQGDLPAAQRHLAAAQRLRPRDPEIDRAYRDVCARLAPVPAAAPAPAAAPLVPEAATTTTLPPSDSAPLDEAQAAARVDELTRVLQADPSRDDVVDELAALLVRLGRSLELLALLTARLEDASPARRAQLLPAQRAVLSRLEEEARAQGRTSEASLFRDALAALAE